VETGNSKKAVAREQLCGHVVSPAMREPTIMEETFSVPSVLRLYNEDRMPLPDILETAIRRIGGWC
jgi:hypothetical protein